MKIALYQINLGRGRNQIYFSYDRIAQRFNDLDYSAYDLTFSGEVNAEDLEEVFAIFNRRHPAGFKGRSMSVSDVVGVVENGRMVYYFCDRVGFRQICFNAVEALQAQIATGTKILLYHMNDPYPVPDGTKGTVFDVDDAGQIHCRWTTGSTLAVVPGVDSFRVL